MKGVSPDVVTYTTLMKAFMRAKRFNKVLLILNSFSHFSTPYFSGRFRTACFLELRKKKKQKFKLQERYLILFAGFKYLNIYFSMNNPC